MTWVFSPILQFHQPMQTPNRRLYAPRKFLASGQRVLMVSGLLFAFGQEVDRLIPNPENDAGCQPHLAGDFAGGYAFEK
jgi:hypothetical protein